MTRFVPGQRVRINEKAADQVPEFVGMLGTVGIGGVNAPYYFRGGYYVSIYREKGARIILHLPEHCIDERQFERILDKKRRGRTTS